MTIDINTSERIPRRARGILNRLLAGRQLTHDGLQWLIQALDGFHDTPIQATGLPDGQNTRSLPQIIRKQITITKPPATLAGGTWEARVDITPVIQAWTASNVPLIPGTIGAAGTMPTNIAGSNARITSGVSVNAFPSGASWYASTNTVPDLNLGLGANATDDPRRIVGIAFEVVNNTAPIYRSGSVTVWRLPTNIEPNDQWRTGPGVFVGTVTNATGFPMNYPLLTQDPGALTWAAAEGAYVNGSLYCVEDTPFAQYRPVSAQLASWASNAAQPCFYLDTSATPAANYDVRFSNLNCSGAWFTGLSEQTSLTITAKYLVEDLVPVSDTNFPLTRIAPPRDMLALEIYSRCLGEIPPGCMVKDNPLGEWFNTVMDAVAAAAPVAASFIPGVGPLIGSGVSALARAAGNYNRSLARGPAPKAPPKPSAAKVAAALARQPKRPPPARRPPVHPSRVTTS